MQNASARPADRIETVLQTYGNMLFRLSLVMLGNEKDAEDAVQETIMKYLQKAPIFTDPEHEKAWLLKVSANQCRDMLRFRLRHPQTDLDALRETAAESAAETADSGILEALMRLPEKYKLVLILYYVEEYRIEEIANLIGRRASAVKMRMQKCRRLLEETYRKEYL